MTDALLRELEGLARESVGPDYRRFARFGGDSFENSGNAVDWLRWRMSRVLARLDDARSLPPTPEPEEKPE